MLDIKNHRQGIVFKIHVQPRSSKNMISGLHDDALKIKIKAPPVEGAANKAIIQFLAKCLNAPKGSFQILSGQTGRIKRILYLAQPGKITQKIQDDMRSQVLSLIKGKQSS